MNDTLRNRYTDAPTLTGNLLTGSVRLLFWLFFHPSAWRNHLKRIDSTLWPYFSLADLQRKQWRNTAVLRFLLMTFFAWPLLVGLLLGLVLWLLNLPTGALIILLNRYIPESPRFLALAGLEDQARAVLQRFSGTAAPTAAPVHHAGEAARPDPHASARIGMRQLLRGRHAAISWGLVVCAVAWGLANFGFLLWLPANPINLGIDAQASAALLARSAILALPGIGVVVWFYQRWSSIRTLVLFIGLTALSLLFFFAIALADLHSTTLTIVGTVALLLSISGVIATLIPYAAEIYPVHLRSTGAGLIAGGSKFGGILGAVIGVAMGKSTLVNALVPDAGAITREISAALDSGKHTTTHACLYHLDAESHLIDSPGLQEFGLNHLDRAAVELAFPEFRPFLGACRFRDCRHDLEPDCALQAAVANGHVDAGRFAAYHRIVQTKR